MLADDGDRRDVRVVVDAPSFPGWVQIVRPIGVLEMTDGGKGDEKILAVGKSNPRYKDVWNYSEIYPHMLREITHFFSIYKDLEGKRVETRGWQDAAAARALIGESQKSYADQQKRAAGKTG